jgi:dihydrofolate reductase
MRRLSVFDQVSLDGFFVDGRGDMSWAHRDDPEWGAFMAENSARGGALLFGRVTYELMAGFWATPAGRAANPAVADRMTRMPKYVFSRTLATPSWENTTVLAGDAAAEVTRLKAAPGPDLTILGSGTIISPLTDAGLIDEYQIVVSPIVLGSGRSIFDGVGRRVMLTLARTRGFANGNVVSWYEPAGPERA